MGYKELLAARRALRDRLNGVAQKLGVETLQKRQPPTLEKLLELHSPREQVLHADVDEPEEDARGERLVHHRLDATRAPDGSRLVHHPLHAIEPPQPRG